MYIYDIFRVEILHICSLWPKIIAASFLEEELGVLKVNQQNAQLKREESLHFYDTDDGGCSVDPSLVI